jgi:hypothetical protein
MDLIMKNDAMQSTSKKQRYRQKKTQSWLFSVHSHIKETKIQRKKKVMALSSASQQK